MESVKDHKLNKHKVIERKGPADGDEVGPAPLKSTHVARQQKNMNNWLVIKP